jgi:hypothetical protein
MRKSGVEHVATTEGMINTCTFSVEKYEKKYHFEDLNMLKCNQICGQEISNFAIYLRDHEPTIKYLAEVYRGYPQSLQTNPEITLNRATFNSRRFQIFIYQSPLNSTV